MMTLESAVSCVSDYDPHALPVGTARAIVQRIATPVCTLENVALRDALDRVLALDVSAPIDVPAWDNSAMDGYAFASHALAGAVDGLLTLTLAGTALAGQPFVTALPAGACVRIMTGALIPSGCDTVIQQEAVECLDAHGAASPVAAAKIAEAAATAASPKASIRVRFATAGLRAGANLRRAGEDLRRGAPVLSAGRILRPSDLGLLASLGLGTVPVRRRLRVAYFSTGDELRSIGQPLEAGCVYDSNRYTLDAMLRRLNVEPIDLGVVRDDPAALEAAFRQAAACADAVLTSGGVSVGDADFVRPLMASLGEVVFWKLAMRPGRPLAFGRLHGTAGTAGTAGRDIVFFGLPGNPVAVMVSFYQFVHGALLSMMGATPAAPTRLRARAAVAIGKRAGRTEYLRGVATRSAEGAWSVELAGAQGSGVLRSMSDANCFIELEHEQGAVQAGTPVDIVLFDGLI